MLFHTWAFVLFFLITYPIYLALKGTRFRLYWLLAVSYFFYACFNPFFLFLIAYSTILDYTVVTVMEKYGRRKLWLSISIVNNLFLLSLFKYAGFITDNLNVLLSSLNVPYVIPAPGLPFPVGISFYIFQSMSYTIDYYRGNMEREKSLIRYATFVSLFPRLLAGPIERAKNLLPQLHKKAAVSMHDFSDGLSLFIVGLFKKVALADYLALYVDNIYSTPDRYQSPALILATFLFCWQIYFDFSGYTDMARGIARMMGFRLMLNFNNPYLATSLGDFWSRWHISLSSWFKDYVYIPLGGNRRGKFNTYRNMFLTMVISGLWHGAAWTFIIWGAVHALGRFCTRELESTSFYKEKVPKIVKQVFVFVFVTFAWIFFRAESISDAWIIITRILTSGFRDPRCPFLALALVLAVWLYQFFYESRLKWLLEQRYVRIGLIIFMVLYLALFAPSSRQPFIYLQF
ncbi:MAG: MBOAT family protein [Phycisphaerae bacterium]|nr:MBOAT family protein [Phycisphaerae bacterium]NIR67033.1 MBOAT family protein [candidate division Zixibacteria bacterium]NIP51901.1 MBOAT family protein [Phycisphaerae bacterium]NIS52901.1 MBOAT family protein [Phycisphaerae bacterium]NIU10388.1 MBOAT family protein [Phycisphaerae bacterium]